MSNRIEEIPDISKVKSLSSGIDGLDFQLDGGIPAGSLILVMCDPLTGIEKLSKQFWEADDSGKSSYFMLDSTVEAGMADAGKMNPGEISANMTGKWVVVDSLSTMLLKYGIDDIIEFLNEVSGKVRKEGGNILLIMYTGIHSAYEEILIKRNCDTIFTLNLSIHGNEIERNLQVNKIRGLDLPKRVFPYNILNKGIELSTTGRVV